ncbi:hypothetical protein BH10CYA1_BH10CYA1_28890 [soil metagenome]
MSSTQEPVLNLVHWTMGIMSKNSKQKKCPFCKELTPESEIQCRHCHLDTTAPYEPCPQCGFIIKSEAVVCRHCHYALGGDVAGWDTPGDAKVNKEGRPIPALDAKKYGEGVRSQVFEVIVRQGLAGAPWRIICAGPMQVNNISPDDVEAEINRRRDLLK